MRMILRKSEDDSGHELIELQAKKPSMVVQSLIFSKDKFKSASEAKRWAKDHGFKTDKVDDTEGSYRLRQKDPEGFADKSFRTFKITDGVQAVGAKMKKVNKSSDDFVSRLEKVFGKERVSEVMKFEQENSSSYMTQGLRQNKEIFDGSKYLNVAPGKRVAVTEGNGVKKSWEKVVQIKKTFDEKQIVIGEVYVPYDPSDASTVDTQNMYATAEEIEKAAYEFMEKYRQIDKQHNFKPGYGVVVESYIAKAGDPMFKEGSWVLGVRVTDNDVWSKIKSGEITGFSLAGSARLVEQEQAA